MSQPDALAQLAAEMVPCPGGHSGNRPPWPHPVGHQCYGCKTGLHKPHEECPDCHGTGRVPLIPGLRVPCRPHFRASNGDERCGDRQQRRDCPGYIVLSGAEALGVLLEWAAHEGMSVEFVPLVVGVQVTVKGLNRGDRRWGGGQGTVADALAAAVTQARGLKVTSGK